MQGKVGGVRNSRPLGAGMDSSALVEGDCIIESVGGPAPGPDPAWSGRLQEPAPTMNLVEGGAAWLRLADGRECEIQVERALAGSGITEFSGSKGILDLH
jgi:hypothetical protein